MEKRDLEAPAYRRRLLQRISDEREALQQLTIDLLGHGDVEPLSVSSVMAKLFNHYQKGIQHLANELLK